jgi:hypothetical protein
MKYPLFIFASLVTTAVFSSGLRASEISLDNSSLDGSGNIVQGWQINNAEAITTSDGETVVLLPSEFPARFSKLWQRLPFDGNAYESLRVEMKVRAVERADLGMIDTSLPKPRLRIFYFPEETRWKQDEVLWPQGKEGILQAIEPDDGWQTVSFELECPEETRNVEIAVETDNSGYAIEVDEITIDAVSRN